MSSGLPSNSAGISSGTVSEGVKVTTGSSPQNCSGSRNSNVLKVCHRGFAGGTIRGKPFASLRTEKLAEVPLESHQRCFSHYTRRLVLVISLGDKLPGLTKIFGKPMASISVQVYLSKLVIKMH